MIICFDSLHFGFIFVIWRYRYVGIGGLPLPAMYKRHSRAICYSISVTVKVGPIKGEGDCCPRDKSVKVEPARLYFS